MAEWRKDQTPKGKTCVSFVTTESGFWTGQEREGRIFVQWPSESSAVIIAASSLLDELWIPV